MFHARHRQPLENLGVLASVDNLPWPGQVPGPLKFVHGQVGDQPQVGAVRASSPTSGPGQAAAAPR